MSNIQIIVGSMLGGTEYVAEACQESLEELGHNVTVHLTPKFTDIASKDQTWLVCTSTHGAGDYPDNIVNFIQDLSNDDQDLSTSRYFVIGVGDSNYDTFCFAAKNIETLLKSKGLEKIIPLKTLDMSQDIDPEDLAQAWINEHSGQL